MEPTNPCIPRGDDCKLFRDISSRQCYPRINLCGLERIEQKKAEQAEAEVVDVAEALYQSASPRAGAPKKPLVTWEWRQVSTELRLLVGLSFWAAIVLAILAALFSFTWAAFWPTLWITFLILALVSLVATIYSCYLDIYPRALWRWWMHDEKVQQREAITTEEVVDYLIQELASDSFGAVINTDYLHMQQKALTVYRERLVLGRSHVQAGVEELTTGGKKFTEISQWMVDRVEEIDECLAAISEIRKNAKEASRQLANYLLPNYKKEAEAVSLLLADLRSVKKGRSDDKLEREAKEALACSRSAIIKKFVVITRSLKEAENLADDKLDKFGFSRGDVVNLAAALG